MSPIDATTSYDFSGSSFEVIEASNLKPEAANKYPEDDEDGFEEVFKMDGQNIWRTSSPSE